VARDSRAMALATPSIAHGRELARSGAPSDAEVAKQHKQAQITESFTPRH